MPRFDHRKYRPSPPITKPDRRWPDQTIDQAPLWCSVDLRDGNQALIEPMTQTQKLRMFKLLVEVGFKEIEVGFPAASQTDFDFVRRIIEEQLIPADVTIQVLTPARQELIERSFESLQGSKSATVHLYNSTSRVQREQVFKLGRTQVKHIALQGAQWVKEYAARHTNTDWHLQYSPESFTGTEMDFAIEVCEGVSQIWQGASKHPIIINLPATVEMTSPNVYADQIEYFCDHIERRDNLIISLHTHNDRGCGVAAAELGLMAGADRVEGTLLGNGERTGNMDIVTMAMNLYSQGIDPTLDFAQMDRIIEVVKDCTQLPVHPRHPYAGELVFAAFSGSHQDAINKCLQIYRPGDPWQVAYLPIDPRDIGRSYQAIIRINSQSGKGGIAYILQQHRGLQLPRWLQLDFSLQVQHMSEQSCSEVSADSIWQRFQANYLLTDSPNVNHFQLHNYRIKREPTVGKGSDRLEAIVLTGQQPLHLAGEGQGAIAAFVEALAVRLKLQLRVIEYAEHALGQGTEADAIAYMQVSIDGQRYCGVGMSSDIIEASLRAVLSAINRAATNTGTIDQLSA